MEVVDLTRSGPKDVSRSVQKKVEKYLERDKWRKVQRMVREGVVGLNSVVGKYATRLISVYDLISFCVKRHGSLSSA